MLVAGQEIGDGDRQRLDIALVDVDLDQRAGGQRSAVAVMPAASAAAANMALRNRFMQSNLFG